MPTTKPRISITIDADDLAVLDRYAAASGTPRASMLGALIKATIPELDRAADLIELANAAPRRVLEGAVENLSNATADAMGFLEPFRADFRAVMATLDDRLQRELPLERGKRRRPGDERRAAPAADAGDRSKVRAGRRKRPGDPRLLTGGSK
jgi:hypothetical protein